MVSFSCCGHPNICDESKSDGPICWITNLENFHPWELQFMIGWLEINCYQPRHGHKNALLSSSFSKRDLRPNKNHWKNDFQNIFIRTFLDSLPAFPSVGPRLKDQMKICIRFRRRLKMIDFEPDALLLLISFYRNTAALHRVTLSVVPSVVPSVYRVWLFKK